MNKSNIRRMGRNIRRATGLSLPVAMGMARVIERDGQFELKYSKKFENYCDIDTTTYCECCGPSMELRGIVGPKGQLDINDIMKPLAPRASKPMPPKVREIRLAVATLDAGLAALRAHGGAMVVNGTPFMGADGQTPVVRVAINMSGNKAHRALVLAGVTPPIGSRDRKILANAI